MQSNELDLEGVEGSKFDFQTFLYKYKVFIAIFLLGLVSIGVGVFYLKNGNSLSSTKVEIIESEQTADQTDLVVEIAGAVVNPGVYKLEQGARVDDVLTKSGGLTAAADRVWFEKTINRAAKINDGQKIYIPTVDEQSDVLSAKSSGVDQNISSGNIAENNKIVNINTASTGELDSLPGIGPVYAQNIIEHRPYSSVEELLSKGALKKNVYEKIKDLVAAY